MLKNQMDWKWPVNCLIDIIVNSKSTTGGLYAEGYFWRFRCSSGFINHHRTPTRESRTKNHCKKHKPLYTAFVLPLCTHQYTSVLSFDVSSIYWQFIWSKKFRNPAHAITTCCVSASHQLHWFWRGSRESSVKRVVSPPAYKMLTIHTQIQEGLHFKCCTMTCRRGKRWSDFSIYHKDQFLNWYTFPGQSPLKLPFSLLSSYCNTNMVPRDGQTHVPFHCKLTYHPSLSFLHNLHLQNHFVIWNIKLDRKTIQSTLSSLSHTFFGCEGGRAVKWAHWVRKMPLALKLWRG